MSHGSGKDVGHRLQVHGHEAAVRCTETAYLLVIDVRVLAAELLCSLDDVIGGVFSVGVDMACGKLLTEACAAAGLYHIHHVTHSCPVVIVVVAVQIAACG